MVDVFEHGGFARRNVWVHDDRGRTEQIILVRLNRQPLFRIVCHCMYEIYYPEVFNISTAIRTTCQWWKWQTFNT
jgi:hypothetical protein